MNAIRVDFLTDLTLNFFVATFNCHHPSIFILLNIASHSHAPTRIRAHTLTRTQKEIQINVAAAFNYDSLFLSSFFVTLWLRPRAAINPSAIICNQILDSKNSDPPMLQRSPLPLLHPPMKFFDSHHNWSNFGGAQIKHESTNTSWEIFSPQIWLP